VIFTSITLELTSYITTYFLGANNLHLFKCVIKLFQKTPIGFDYVNIKFRVICLNLELSTKISAYLIPFDVGVPLEPNKSHIYHKF
jgi:hypothetical protein